MENSGMSAGGMIVERRLRGCRRTNKPLCGLLTEGIIAYVDLLTRE